MKGKNIKKLTHHIRHELMSVHFHIVNNNTEKFRSPLIFILVSCVFTFYFIFFFVFVRLFAVVYVFYYYFLLLLLASDHVDALMQLVRLLLFLLIIVLGEYVCVVRICSVIAFYACIPYFIIFMYF